MYKTTDGNKVSIIVNSMGYFCFCSNEMQQSRILRAKQKKGK